MQYCLCVPHTITHKHSWQLLPLKNVKVKWKLSLAHPKLTIYINVLSQIQTQPQNVCDKTLSSCKPHFSLSHVHTHTHAGADVAWFAWSTVEDRLDLAAPEMDRQSGYCSAGMIQHGDNHINLRARSTHSFHGYFKIWLFLFGFQTENNQQWTLAVYVDLFSGQHGTRMYGLMLI